MPDSSYTNIQPATLPKLKPLYYRKRLWLTLIFLVLSVAHSIWLSWISAFLVSVKPTSSPDIIIPISGRTSLQYAKSLLESNPQILCHMMIESPNRIHRLGIIPQPIEQARKELSELRIDPEIIHFHESKFDVGQHEDVYQRLADQIKLLLAELRPDSKIEIIAPSYMTRRVSWHLQQKLAAETLAKTFITGIPPQDFDLKSWWRSRHGIRCVVGEYLLLVNLFLPDQPLATSACTEEDFRRSAVKEPDRDY